MKWEHDQVAVCEWQDAPTGQPRKSRFATLPNGTMLAVIGPIVISNVRYFHPSTEQFVP